MYIKLNTDKHGTLIDTTFCIVQPTGELDPKMSVRYQGSKEPSREDEQKRFMIEMMLPPHKKAKFQKIFSDATGNIDAVAAQKAMYEKFLEELEKNFILEIKKTPDEQVLSNDEPAEPVYFYIKKRLHSTFDMSEIVEAKYQSDEKNKAVQISIFAGEQIKLCTVNFLTSDEALAVAVVKRTIMSLSKKAALDFNDIFSSIRRNGGNDGPGGMQ